MKQDETNTLTDEQKEFIKDLDGYLKVFYWYCAYYDTNEEAWKATENRYRALTGHSKYSTYDSFKAIRTRLQKTKLPTLVENTQKNAPVKRSKSKRNKK